MYSDPSEIILPDVHGNLMVKMQKERKKGLFIHFDSIMELNQIIANNNGLVHHNASKEYDELLAEYVDMKGGKEEEDKAGENEDEH